MLNPLEEKILRYLIEHKNEGEFVSIKLPDERLADVCMATKSLARKGYVKDACTLLSASACLTPDGKYYFNMEEKRNSKAKKFYQVLIVTSKGEKVVETDITDIDSRAVVGYKIGIKNSTQLTKSTFKTAYINRQPQSGLMFHSDNGGNYCCKTFQTYLIKLNVEQSFSRPYVPYDNSVMESFFSSVKREELYRRKFKSENEFHKSVDEYIIFYNEKRPHYQNIYRTPLKKEQDYYASIEQQ